MPSAGRHFDALSRRQQALKWRYLCYLTIPHPELIRPWWGTPQIILTSHSHQEASPVVAELRDYGAGKIYYGEPILALCTSADLVTARLVFAERLEIIYDVFENQVLVGRGI